MASNRSKSKKTKRSSIFSRLVGIIWIVVTGGGIAGWTAPDLPVIGPLVQRIANTVTSREGSAAAEGNLGDQLVNLKDRVSGTVGGAPTSIPGAGSGSPTGNVTPVSRKPAETMTIATFNIQVFGESKLSKTWVVEILAQVVRQFDVVAIQEIRAKSDQIIPQFVEAVNADGSRYNYVIGPRLGRTASKEQYVFVYDTNRIEIDTSSSGTIQDPNDLMHREPFVTRFRTRTANPSGSFTFWLVNSHTDPDEVPQEVDALADVFVVMQQAGNEDDVILLGDLNASDRQFGRLGQINGINWAVHDTTTNTRRSKMYDNILFDRNRTAEYTGRWGVYDLEAAFNLSRDQALAVSDHLPVWAEFSIMEAPAGSTARNPLGGLMR